MADTIKIGSLDISAFKVGSSDCKIYLGDTLLYPQSQPSYKLVAQYSDSTEYRVECDGGTALTKSMVEGHTTPKSAMTDAVISNCEMPTFKVGDNSFSGCTSLSSVTLNEGITEIGQSTFLGTSNLRNITFPSTLTTIGGTAFRQSGLRNVSGIPSGVTTLGSGAFADCLSLSSATIPSTVTGSSTNLFLRDSALTQVHFEGTTAPVLGADVFNGCTSLVKIYIPSCDCFDSYAAQSQFNEKSDIIYGEDEEKCKTSYNYKLYRKLKNGVTNTTSCNSSSALTSGDVRANYTTSVLTSSTSGLTEAIVGDCVTSVSAGAFYGMTQLTSITLSDSVTSVGKSACTTVFGASNKIHDINLGKHLTTIEEKAFSYLGATYATNQPNVKIPKSVTSIGRQAFWNSKMNELVFENGGDIAIGAQAFSGLSSYSGISIHTNSIRSLGYQAFRCASGLTSVYISGLTGFSASVGTGSMFGLCHDLTDLTIIGNGSLAIPQTFVGGNSLTAVTLGGIVSISNANGLNNGKSGNIRQLTMLDTTPPAIGSSSISDYNPTVIYVPSSAVNTYKSANNWKTYSSIIQAIPNS